MRIAVLQPSYLPWLGYLDQIARSDAFVFYDDVQYDKSGWRNRNRIRVERGEGWAWLTIPVRGGASRRIIDVSVDARVPWRRKHESTIRSEYARAPSLDLIDRNFAEIFSGDETRLAEISIESTKCFLRALKIETPLYRSSELSISGAQSERLLNICKHFGATSYLSGSAARAYLDVALFEKHGIAVEWQDYAHPAYPQQHEPFISHLSALDALLNVGIGARAFLGKADLVAPRVNSIQSTV